MLVRHIEDKKSSGPVSMASPRETRSLNVSSVTLRVICVAIEKRKTDFKNKFSK